MYKHNYKDRSNDKYQYNYEDEVKDSEYLSLNINLKNKIVLGVLVVLSITLVSLLLMQLLKYNNRGSRNFNTKCNMASPIMTEEQLFDVILSNQLPSQ